MKSLCLALAGAGLLCGCDKQTKLNIEQTAALAQQLVAVQQTQVRQLATIQAELATLAPALEQTNNFFFEKSHEDAFFYHTNQLYLLLMVDRKIEAELQEADLKREAEGTLAYLYHTNQLGALALALAQIQDALAAQENRMQTNLDAATRVVVGAVTDGLAEQTKALTPDAASLAREQQLAADVAQLKRDLDQIKTKLGLTNLPVTGP